MSRIAFVAAICVLLAGPAIALDKETVQEQASKFAEAFNRGDAAAVASMYTEDAYLMPPQSAQVQGRAGIEQFWNTAAEQMSDLQLTTMDVKQLGPDAAREIGRFTIKSKGQPDEEITGKYVIILEKDGDDWKIATDIWNTDQ